MVEKPDITPRQAMERWLDKQRVEHRDSTVSTYYYRLKLFVEWCESQGINDLMSLTGWSLETYETHRRSKDPKPITLNKEFGTLENWLEYCERIEIASEEIAEKLEIPDVSKEDRSSDVKLDQERAKALLTYFRSTPEAYGSREHVLLELEWHTGARAGAIAGLDLRDLDRTEDGTRYLEFKHRPETGTPLKNGIDGERAVALNEETWKVIDFHVDQERRDVEDEFGRQPLLYSRVGRPSPGSIRDWTYLATQPCLHDPCPHGKDRDSCDWVSYSHASKCPSSRSPHQVRTGSITWMRNRGTPVEIVSERVNSGVDVIKEHYDKEDPVQELIQRRAEYTQNLDIDGGDDDDE